MKKLLFLLMFFSIKLSFCNAQNRTYDLKGYVIETRGNYVFQPCNESSDILGCLNSNLFSLSFDIHEGVISPSDFDLMRNDV